MAEDYETQINIREYFLRFSHEGDAMKFYNIQTSSGANWNSMVKEFHERYLSSDIQEENPGRLATLSLQDYKIEEESNDHAASDFLIEKIKCC